MNFRTHVCRDCGFLCINAGSAGNTHISEYTPSQRLNGMEHAASGFARPRCYRRVIEFELEVDEVFKKCPRLQDAFGGVSYESNTLAELIRQLINKPRRCALFTPYQSGYNPELHLQRHEMIERDRSNRRWNLIWLLVGAALTIAGGWIISLFHH